MGIINRGLPMLVTDCWQTLDEQYFNYILDEKCDTVVAQWINILTVSVIYREMYFAHIGGVNLLAILQHLPIQINLYSEWFPQGKTVTNKQKMIFKCKDYIFSNLRYTIHVHYYRQNITIPYKLTRFSELHHHLHTTGKSFRQ